MKNILVLFLLVNSFSFAQYAIKGTLDPVENSSWILLYKVEAGKQLFIKNTKIKREGQKGFFEFSLPQNAEIGVYRIKFGIKEGGVLDVLFNREPIEVSFNPKDVENSIQFNNTKENSIYRQFLKEKVAAQFHLDSLQGVYFRNPSRLIEEKYLYGLNAVQKIQKTYLERARGMLAYHFIKASDRYNAPVIEKRPDEYINNLRTHFFDAIDFSNKVLYNSSFLTEKISEYVYYLNESVALREQKKEYIRATETVLRKIKDPAFKKEVIELLISRFAAIKNAAMADYLFENHFDQLPRASQNIGFKNKILARLRIATGRVAPDFFWEEKGKQLHLSGLKDAMSYLLIFYSTECSHCLNEVPKVFEFLKGKTKTTVVAFAMETSEKIWLNYQKKMPGWHHVLGLKKWQNKVARTYQIHSTPTYFVLGKDKRILANPEGLSDLKLVLEQLN